MKRKPPKWALWVLIGFNVLVALLIFCATVYVSFSHTLALYKAVGFTDWKAIAATVAGEALFILGAVNAIFALLFGISLGWVPWIAFILGIVLSGWANGAAHSKYGLLGVALGLSTPVFMFVAKLNISNALEKFSGDDENVNDSVNEKQTVSNESVSENIISENVSRIINRDSISPIINEQTVSATVSLTDDETISLMNSGSVNLTNDETIKESTNSAFSDDNISKQTVSDTISENVNLMNNETISNESISENVNESVSEQTVNEIVNDKIISEKTVSENTVSNETVSDENINKTVSRSKVVNLTNRKRKNTDAEIARVKEVALRYQQQNGELPGRPTLVDLAHCSHYVAKKALDELREKIS